MHPLNSVLRFQMFFKIGVLRNFAIFTGKHLHLSNFLIKLQAFKPATLLKRDSNTGVFLLILWNFKEHFFRRTPPDDCFWRKLDTTTYNAIVFLTKFPLRMLWILKKWTFVSDKSKKLFVFACLSQKSVKTLIVFVSSGSSSMYWHIF